MKPTLALFLLMAGCTRSMTNEQIIAETKKCQAAGLKATPLVGWSGETEKIECRP